MRAIDTNILVFSEIKSSPFHKTALNNLVHLSQGTVPWAISWPCIYEFLRIVTHPRIYHPPMPVHTAMDDLQHILSSPTLIVLSETSRHQEIMNRMIRDSGCSGNLIHDAHIATLCVEHGVTEFITGDRDFSRFPELPVQNPFVQ